jgi:hypothetical protein
MAQYFLASHAYLCVTEDHVVLLDLQRDKYLGVAAEHMQALSEVVSGWPNAVKDSTQASPQQSEIKDVLQQMLADQILTTDERAGKAAIPVQFARPESSLLTFRPYPGRNIFDTKPDLHAGLIARFLTAVVRARANLRLRSLQSIVHLIRDRKARHATAELSIEAVRPLVAAYQYLKPLLFKGQDACLFDSLALLHFLAGYGYFPTWIYAVQTVPFAAHCWIQHADVCLNDTPDNVRRYTPILTV